jgi:hypothetical protein
MPNLMEIRTPDIIVSPVEDPTIDQIRFWLRIMREHAFFISIGLPCDQTVLIREAQRFVALFTRLQEEAAERIGEAVFPDFLRRVRAAVEELWAFKRRILHLMITCEIVGGANYPLLIDHISREAAYFIKLLNKFIEGETDLLPIDSIVQENVFWLRIMLEHIKFVRGLLDPSERGLIAAAAEFNTEFDQLLAQARDLESMLWDFRPINDLRRFQNIVESATVRLRNFKRELFELLEECAALSIIPPLLADHVRREADHFLELIELLEEREDGGENGDGGRECRRPGRIGRRLRRPLRGEETDLTNSGILV